MFRVSPHPALQKTEKEICFVFFPFSDFLYMHWRGNQGLSALWPHTSSYPFAIWWLSVRTSKVVLIVLMIMCHSNMSHVRHGAGLPARRQAEATGWCCVLCSKWLMTLPVAVLWLRLWWFIAIAHNVIRLSIYTQQNSFDLLYDPNVCVCVRAHAPGVIFIYYYIILWWRSTKHSPSQSEQIPKEKKHTPLFTFCVLKQEMYCTWALFSIT